VDVNDDAVAAAASASTATTAAGTATTQADIATTQAGIATTKASEALASANSAAASFDSFDDRYLGAKTSDPTLDNDGNALLVGALYFNSSVSEMRAWNGTAWAAAYLPAGAYATVSGTETLTNKTISFADNTLTDVAGTTATQTLTNKTLNAVVLNDGYTEEVFAVTGTTPALSPINGSIQTWTLSGNSTPTAGTWASGQSLTLMVDDGSAYAITWPSVTWKTDGGDPPTLNTTGYTVVQLWKVDTVIYGARVGDA
jgi:hypothetical protein